MLFDKNAIAGMIPHKDAMCLLDGVLSWDAANIRCVATSHSQKENPLAREGMLHAVCGLEYAAQAMAVHGYLTGAVAAQPRTGYLASVRDLAWSTDRLDLIGEDLIVEAELLAQNGANAMYRFQLGASGAILVRGRAAVILNRDAP